MNHQDIAPGMKVRVAGTPLHHGKIGTVVNTALAIDAARKLARETGRQLVGAPTARPGLVPIFMPDHPETLWWWFAPHQLSPET